MTTQHQPIKHLKMRVSIKSFFLFISFLLLSVFGFSQISVSDMIKIYSMNYDQFEDFTLNRGWEIQEVKKNDDYDGITYRKINLLKIEFISLYQRWFDYGKNVNYQTHDGENYLKFKEELKKLDFKLISTKSETINEQNYILNTYKKNISDNLFWELRIYSIPPKKDELYGGYEISLKSIVDFNN